MKRTEGAGCEAANRFVNSGGSAEQALQQLGTLAKGILVQDEIVNGGFAPNAESTIQKKGSEQPRLTPAPCGSRSISSSSGGG